jgi:hypothetical protein
MIIFKYCPRISRKEKAKRIIHDHLETVPNFYTDLRTRELYQMFLAATAERNIELYPQINRMYGMRIERRNNDEQ